ncbi:chitinase [Streptomyces sp. B93]|uniref:chitinase n=1 Tax=Streptomyces sp. B93 TaxID=2824875 RepID=UPI001B36EDBD|nr:chitinase [Streptomyces sp. B93]MBQ1093550.1 chitinase [Streptomyces sp. B93]
MRSFLKPVAGLSCLLALAVTGCSTTTTATAESTQAQDAPEEPYTSYAPYVSATAAADQDTAGSPAAYNLAFVISEGDGCTPAWGGSHGIDDSAVTSRIAALGETGAALRVSFGGASGAELATVCDSAEDLAEAYGAALDAAGATRADFDIEGDTLTDSGSVALRSEAVALLQEQRPGLDVSFTLPVMPSGLDDDSVTLLESANDHGVQVATVNIMTMNYGSTYTGDMGDYALDSAKATHAQLKEIFGQSDEGAWHAMALTSMIGVNDVDDETFTLADAAQVRTFAEEKEIAWVSMWSTFRDQQCADEGSPATECTGVTQSPGAFAEAFTG